MSVCFVVGAGPGMGAAIARRFAREGFDLGLIARSSATLADARASIPSGVRCETRPVDVADFDALRAALHGLATELGPAGVLVYNVAVMRMESALALDAEHLIADTRSNVAAALVAAQSVIASMREQGRGTILFTGGALALAGASYATSLGIGKAAIRKLTFDLAEELEPLGVHIASVTIAGAVAPGGHFDPDLIAERYWTLHSESRDSWTREIVYR